MKTLKRARKRDRLLGGSACTCGMLHLDPQRGTQTVRSRARSSHQCWSQEEDLVTVTIIGPSVESDLSPECVCSLAKVTFLVWPVAASTSWITAVTTPSVRSGRSLGAGGANWAASPVSYQTRSGSCSGLGEAASSDGPAGPSVEQKRRRRSRC